MKWLKLVLSLNNTSNSILAINEYKKQRFERRIEGGFEENFQFNQTKPSQRGFWFDRFHEQTSSINFCDSGTQTTEEPRVCQKWEANNSFKF